MVSKLDMSLIYIGYKWVTMRPTTDRHKIGSTYQVKLNLFDKYAFRVKILSKELINIDDMDDADFIGIDYSKEEYLKHSYNTKNPSPLRYKYTFEIVETDFKRLNEIIGDV